MCRASTSLRQWDKTWMAGTSPAMTGASTSMTSLETVPDKPAWVRLQARTAPRASGGARHHGVRARCRRRRRPPGPFVLPKHDDEFLGVFRHRPARCTGNLAARSDVECDRYDHPADRCRRCTALPDERRDASLVRSGAGMAGLHGSVFSHRCDLVDRHALSLRWRPRHRSVFRRGQCNHDRLAGSYGHRVFHWRLHCRSCPVRISTW